MSRIYALFTITSFLNSVIPCPLFEKEREVMRKRLFNGCGFMHLDLKLNILLGARKDNELKEWRSVILSEHETYVAKTERFATQSANQ